MATPKNIADMKINAAVDTPTISMSPLRRKSVFSRKVIGTPTLLENDDETERLIFRRETNATSTPIIKNTSGRRSSIGLSSLVNVPTSQMTEHISQCIKLGTENKINPRNAFSLKIIDFMAYLIKKQDDKMNNLQVASTSLDVSTQIYGHRVDGVHTEILKMMDGMDIGEKNNMNANAMDVNGGNENQLEDPAKKRKRKNRQQIFSTVENLRTNVETRKPSLITMEEDLQSTDMLRQVTLPIHANSRFYLHPYNDVLLDSVDYKRIQSKDISCSTLRIGGLSNMQICPPLHHFNFQNFNEDDETEKDLGEQTSDSRFQFDLDASISQEDDHPCTNMDYFNVEENEEENVNRYAKHPDQVQNLVDFQEVLSTSVPTKVSEYSFIPKNLNLHWAIPTYWRNTNFRKMLTNSGVVETCHQAPNKRRKEIELCYNDDTVNSVNDKFLPGKGITLNRQTTKRNWKEEILTLPPDKHYDVAQATKLYLHPMIAPKRRDVVSSTCLPDADHNYGDECEVTRNSQSDNNECRETAENNVIDNVMGSEDEIMPESQPFTGNNLVTAPKLTNKFSINYCVREKKIDMGQLKKSIWKCLITDDSKKIKNSQASNENVQQNVCDRMNEKKYFSEIYKELPNTLTKDNSKELSYPIAFVSLLHLANEKSLKITSSPDVSDLTIEQD
ncbi:condensin complex subunit 2-like [Colletes gigas]|uniref:condensin complex subunit 2-like n=1 Tax=Colletes gigas TaxID=935657 RepID=UPI001C9B4A1A|nr:condensin complex subunit 2-like [Colletes gigas]